MQANDSNRTKRAKRLAFTCYKGVKPVCIGIGLGAALFGQFNTVGACVVGLGIWMLIRAFQGPEDTLRQWGLGTRRPRLKIFEQELAKRPASFRSMSQMQQATISRGDKDLQLRFWWEASSVMWMRANLGQEHLCHSCRDGTPGLLDDACAWNKETTEKLMQAAHAGWICPEAKMAWLFDEPRRAISSRTFNSTLWGVAPSPRRFPGQVRFNHTLGPMARELYDSDFGEQLAGLSKAALESIKIEQGMSFGTEKKRTQRL